MFDIVCVGGDEFLEAIKKGSLGCEVFADAILAADKTMAEYELEQRDLSKDTFIGACALAFSATIAATAFPALAIVPIALSGGSIASAWKDWADLKAPKLTNAKAVKTLLTDATADEWSDLASRCQSTEHFFSCLNAGLVATRKSGARKGEFYHASLAYAHRSGVALPEEYEPEKATGFAKPKSSRSWREEEIESFDSDPTDAELFLIVNLCRERAGCTAQVIERAIKLKESNKAAATNLLIVAANINERDYKKGGIEPARLRAIKKWAAAGDRALPEVAPEPVAVAVKPSFQSIPKTVVETPPIEIAQATQIMSAVAPVEEEVPVRILEDEEIEDDSDDAVIESTPSIAAPTMQHISISSLNIWDSTDLETIEPSAIGNVNQFPFVMVVAGQGCGKTATIAYIFESLEGSKALFTPKTDDHLNPAIQNVYDLKFGFNPVNRRGAWFGSTDSFDNSPQMDLDWYQDLATSKSGSALDFLHATYQTAENRTAQGTRKGRKNWRVFYDEAAQTYVAGFTNVIGPEGTSLGRKGESDCQWFISSKLKPAIFNFRGAGIQLFIGCQSETVESIGLKGCAEARDEAWHLYPGQRAIDVAIRFKQSKLAAFLKRAVSDGYAIAVLEKEGAHFKIIRMPKLSELKRFDPIDEPESSCPVVASEPMGDVVPEDTEDLLVEDADLNETDWIEQILGNPNLSTKQKKALITLGRD